MRTPEVLLVDDHAIIRRGMKFILDSNFKRCDIDEAENCKGMMEMLSRRSYTHMILDLQLPDCNVINVFSSIYSQYPDLLILIYTMSPEETFGKRLMQMGAMGFLSKQSNEEEVIKALNLFLLGRKYINSKIKELLRSESEKDTALNPFEELSAREVAVVNSLLMGMGVKEIAGTLELKSTTVATYKARIFDKLGVSNLMDLRSVAELYRFVI